MAVTDKSVTGGNGINYTKEVANSGDYGDLANNTYFKNLSDGLIRWKNTNGDIINIFEAGNATHTSEVTGATALTLDKTAISNKTLVTLAPTDHVLIGDASDSDNLKKVLASDFLAGGVSDGDKGDITVSGGGTVWTLDNTAITSKSSGTVASGDLVLISDISDGNNLKQVTAQSIANLNPTIYNADGTLTANRTVTMSTFGLTFSGNQTTFKGLNQLSGTNVLLIQDSASTELVKITNDGRMVLGGGGGFVGDTPAGIHIKATDSTSALRAHSSGGVFGIALKVFTTTGGQIRIASTGGVDVWQMNGGGDSYFSGAGNFGVGTGSPTLAKLQVFASSGDVFRVEGSNVAYACKITNDMSLYVGSTSPSLTTRLFTKGISSANTDYAFSAENSSGQLILALRNDNAIGLYGATPVVRATTGGAASTFATNTSLIANDTATFDGYTIGQVVKALRNIGILN